MLTGFCELRDMFQKTGWCSIILTRLSNVFGETLLVPWVSSSSLICRWRICICLSSADIAVVGISASHYPGTHAQAHRAVFFTPLPTTFNTGLQPMKI
jgi:hypothetical protein